MMKAIMDETMYHSSMGAHAGRQFTRTFVAEPPKPKQFALPGFEELEAFVQAVGANPGAYSAEERALAVKGSDALAHAYEHIAAMFAEIGSPDGTVRGLRERLESISAEDYEAALQRVEGRAEQPTPTSEAPSAPAPPHDPSR